MYLRYIYIFIMKKEPNRVLILAVRNELAFILHAKVSALFDHEVRSVHVPALGAVPQADTCARPICAESKQNGISTIDRF